MWETERHNTHVKHREGSVLSLPPYSHLTQTYLPHKLKHNTSTRDKNLTVHAQDYGQLNNNNIKCYCPGSLGSTQLEVQILCLEPDWLRAGC